MDLTLNKELRERKTKLLANNSPDGAPSVFTPFRPHLAGDMHRRPVPMCTTTNNTYPRIEDKPALKIEIPDQNTAYLPPGSPKTRNASATSFGVQCTSVTSGISGSCMDDELSHVAEVDGIQVVLEDSHLWQTFYRCGTEMIINRPGRRMFPSVAVSVMGLDPSAMYSVQMEVVPEDDRRYKYVNNKWVAVGKTDPCIQNSPYVHPDSPSKGNYWSHAKIPFSKIKITNNKDSEEGNILLHSMHKYMAQVTITRMRTTPDEEQSTYVFPFPLTAFIAVTAYQSETITQMKIRNNPFAKAFRESDIAEMMNQHVADHAPRYLPTTHLEQASGYSRKAHNSRRHLGTSRLAMSYGRPEGVNKFGQPQNIRSNYAPPFSILPRNRTMFDPDALSFHGRAPGLRFTQPPIGHHSLLDQNEATYRWLFACSQNLAAQMQMFQSRSSSSCAPNSSNENLSNMVATPSRSRDPSGCFAEQISTPFMVRSEVNKTVSDDDQSHSD